MNVEFSQFLTIQRHHGVSMFMVQQDIEMSDLNEFRLADGFIFKPSGLTQLNEKLNRGNVMLQFLNFLRPLSNKETLYMSSDLQTIILFENPLASFWSTELSTPTSKISLTDIRAEDKARAEQRKKIAKEKAGKKYTPPKVYKRETEEELWAMENDPNYGKKKKKKT